jgi:hypothetical protein
MQNTFEDVLRAFVGYEVYDDLDPTYVPRPDELAPLDPNDEVFKVIAEAAQDDGDDEGVQSSTKKRSRVLYVLLFHGSEKLTGNKGHKTYSKHNKYL